jgi:hypothetical protein
MDDSEDADAAAAAGGPPRAPKLIHWVFALRAVDLFYQQHGRLPGESKAESSELSDSQAEHDAQALQQLAERHLAEMGEFLIQTEFL